MFNTIDYYDESYSTLAMQIELSDLYDALVAQGWKQTERDGLFLFRLYDADKQIGGVDLPKKGRAYRAREILDAATDYAYCFQKPVCDVLNEWKNLRFDRARFRVVTSEAVDGSIPLGSAVALARGIEATLASAVKDAESPASAHGRLSSSAIDELSRRACFGQTEKGSYVVNVSVPVDELNDARLFPSARRRVFRQGLERLVSSVALASKSAEESDEAFFAVDESERPSANLLESLFLLSWEGKADVEIRLDWSPLVATKEGVPSRVYLKKEHAAKLKDWAKRLRPVKEESRTARARVVALKALERDKIDGRPSGKVLFRIEDDDKDFNAETLLNPDDFQIACAAFYPNATVVFDARWKRRDGKATIEAATNLRIVD